VETAAEAVTPPEAAPPPASPSPSPRPRRSGLRFLVWLLIVAALGAGGWFGWQFLQKELARQHAREARLEQLIEESQSLRARTTELADALRSDREDTRKNAAEIAALKSRVDDTASALARVNETVQGGRTRMQVAAVEQLLLLANDRALLSHDAIGAAQALSEADERLAGLNEPRLFKVREAIASERAALNALPKVDLTSTALTLSNLIRDLPKLPLQGRAPSELTADLALKQPPMDEPWWQRLWVSLKQAMRAVFIVRHEAGAQALLPPEQETLVIHIGLLKLEGARLALLRGNTAAFREMIGASSEWLRNYYDAQDSAVQAAQAELARLRALELSPAMPDLSHSLALLRETLATPP